MTGTASSDVANHPIHYFSAVISFADHLGTHIDGPRHIVDSGRVAGGNYEFSQIPLSNLVGEACVIDIPVPKDADYLITVADAERWESRHGHFDDDCIVLVRTNYSRHWPHTYAYAGVRDEHDFRHLSDGGWSDRLHWPGLAPDTARWLITQRRIKAIGTDTLSIDAGQTGRGGWSNSVHTVARHTECSVNAAIHTQILLSSNRVGIENLNNLDRLPTRGARIIAAPLRLADASGSPARVIALLTDRSCVPGHFSNAHTLKTASELYLFCTFMIVLYMM